MSQDRIERFQQAVRAFNTGDAESAIAECDPDVEFYPRRALLHGVYRGHAGIREFFADNAENLDLFVADYPDVRDLGDRVLAIGTIRIRGKGSGAQTEMTSAVVLRYRDGKVVWFRDFGDAQAARAAAAQSPDDAEPFGELWVGG